MDLTLAAAPPYTLPLSAGESAAIQKMDSVQFKRLRMDMRGVDGFQSVTVPYNSPVTGTLRLRMTGAERALFMADIMARWAQGEVLEVGGTDLLLHEEDVVVAFDRMFPGRDDWFTVSFDVEEA